MKKVLVIVMMFAMLGLAFAGCATATPTKAVYDLKVWGSQDGQAMLQTMIDAFKAANTDAEYNITLGVVGEGDAKAKVLEDPSAAADVFSFANDQIVDLVNAGALYEVTRNKEAIIAANMPGSVEASTVNGKLYAYPETADNGYFLYYDKSVFTEDDVKSLDKILEVANTAGKKVFMDVSNGWYIASFFLGAGCTLTMGTDGKQVCDFNNANGLLAAEAIKKFTADPAFVTGTDDVFTGGMGTTIAAGVSGTWNAEAVSGSLGANYAATKLPTFTYGTEQKQMGSFAGYKLVGVNALTAAPVEAMKLAEWLTNEQNQVLRFTTRLMGPSNITAASSNEVKANVALAALAAQNQFATSQKEVAGTYWTPAEAFGATMEAKDYTKDLQTLLNEMVAQIQQ